MKKNGRSYSFSEEEIKKLLSMVTNKSINPRDDVEEIILSTLGFTKDEIDDIEEDEEEDIDDLVNRILTRNTKPWEVRREVNNRRTSGCGGRTSGC